MSTRLPNGTRGGLVALTVLAIISSGLSPAGATVSGENGRIAFVTDRDGNREIYSMESDGSDQVNLTGNPATDASPSWSPDGRQIAFATDRSGDWEVYVMDADGGNQTFVAAGRNPTWSPDGSEIAFSRDGDIHVVATDGTGVRRITDSSAAIPQGARGAADHDPDWSPDGSHIVFLRLVQGPTPLGSFSELRTVDAALGGATARLADLGSVARRPDWSPDGTEIVVGDGDLVPGSRVVAFRTDGTGERTLPAPAGMNRNTDPAWSPNGQLLALSAGSVNLVPGEIYVVDADGSGSEVNLTNNAGFDEEPAWQPLNPYAVGLVDPATGIWRLRGESGAVESFYFGNPGDIPFMGDWDCDGMSTPGLYRRMDGFVYLRNSNTQGVADVSFFFGNPGDIPIVGDFDGDGCDTVSIYRPAEARFYVINRLGEGAAGLGQADFSFVFGNPGDQPFSGDFDGDLSDEVALHRASTGRVYFRTTLTEGVAEVDFIFGNPGDRVVAGDWNGDGAESPAVFRPSDTTFYFRFINANGVADAQFIWGSSSWLPVGGP